MENNKALNVRHYKVDGGSIKLPELVTLVLQFVNLSSGCSGKKKGGDAKRDALMQARRTLTALRTASVSWYYIVNESITDVRSRVLFREMGIVPVADAPGAESTTAVVAGSSQAASRTNKGTPTIQHSDGSDGLLLLCNPGCCMFLHPCQPFGTLNLTNARLRASALKTSTFSCQESEAPTSLNVGQSLCHLTSLDLTAACKFSGSELIRVMQEIVRERRARFGEDDSAALEGLKLCCNRFGPQVQLPIPLAGSLRRLDISFTWISDDDLSVLPQFTALESLTMSNMRGHVSDIGVGFVSMLPNLKEVDLSNLPRGASGVSLCSPTLEVVVMEGFRGFESRETFGSFLRGLPRVTSLTLQHGRGGTENTTTLEDKWFEPAASGEPLLGSIAHLNLMEWPTITGEFMAHVSPVALRHLLLRGAAVTDDWLIKYIGRFPVLKVIDVSRSRVTANGLDAIRTDAAQSLTDVGLRWTNLTRDAVCAFQKARPSVSLHIESVMPINNLSGFRGV